MKLSSAAALTGSNKNSSIACSSSHTIIMYMGARSNLAPFAGANLNDIATHLKGSDVNVIVQWDQPGKKGAYRYDIKNGSVELDNYEAVREPGNIKQNLINFVEYAIKKYPTSKKYSLALWNHGTGPLDPIFGDPLRAFLNYRDMLSGKASSIKDFLYTTSKIGENLNHSDLKRGILFDEDNHSYLSNPDLREALVHITSTSLLGQKFENIFFDACFMASIEMFYQVKDFAKYCTASEDLILAYGYPYGSIMTNLTQNPRRNGRELVADVVSYFDSFYKNKTQLYTLSAIDLEKVNDIKIAIDDMCSHTLDAMLSYGKGVTKPFISARKNCQEFSSHVFIDLHSFCQKFMDKLITNPDLMPTGTILRESEASNVDEGFLRSKRYNEKIISLFSSIKNVLKCIESSVIANCCSKYLGKSKGISIYFPTSRHLDMSYQRNEFCKNESGWFKLLTTVLDQV